MTDKKENLEDVSLDKFTRQNDSEHVRVMAGDHARVYANNIEIGFSTWDMWIAFGEVIENKDSKPVVEERVRVTMSLEHAKVAILLLYKNLIGFEKAFGPIRLFSITDNSQELEQKPAMPATEE